MFKQVLKFALMFFFIFMYMIHATLLWLVSRDIWTFRQKIIPWISAYSRLGIRIMGFRIAIVGPHERLSQGPFLVASNHMSYLDILILSSQMPGCFVTSQEIREIPFLGHLCMLAGCLFVERRNKENIHNEIYELTEALRKGMNVIFFPEATSTNGEQILRFRKPLFQSAINAPGKILPMCLNYIAINNDNVSAQNRDLLCWYGDMEFAPHLWKLMRAKTVDVQIQVLDVVTLKTDNPQELAELSQHQVTRAFRPVQIDSTVIGPAQ